jgi:hypothetical protein
MKRKSDNIGDADAQEEEHHRTIKRRQTAKELMDASRSNLDKLEAYKQHLGELRIQIAKGELQMAEQAEKRRESRRLLKEMRVKKQEDKEALTLHTKSVDLLNQLIAAIQL